MLARVATFEGEDPGTMEENIGQMRDQSASGPPEGVPATGFLVLVDRAGKSLVISFFESEEDLRKGDEALNQMSPPTGMKGKRSAVETFEVAIDIRPS
jgi:hypothetical protein